MQEKSSSGLRRKLLKKAKEKWRKEKRNSEHMLKY